MRPLPAAQVRAREARHSVQRPASGARARDRRGCPGGRPRTLCLDVSPGVRAPHVAAGPSPGTHPRHAPQTHTHHAPGQSSPRAWCGRSPRAGRGAPTCRGLRSRSPLATGGRCPQCWPQQRDLATAPLGAPSVPGPPVTARGTEEAGTGTGSVKSPTCLSGVPLLVPRPGRTPSPWSHGLWVCWDRRGPQGAAAAGTPTGALGGDHTVQTRTGARRVGRCRVGQVPEQGVGAGAVV